jgi:hypothetical protein
MLIILDFLKGEMHQLNTNFSLAKQGNVCFEF